MRIIIFLIDTFILLAVVGWFVMGYLAGKDDTKKKEGEKKNG